MNPPSPPPLKPVAEWTTDEILVMGIRQAALAPESFGRSQFLKAAAVWYEKKYGMKLEVKGVE